MVCFAVGNRQGCELLVHTMANPRPRENETVVHSVGSIALDAALQQAGIDHYLDSPRSKYGDGWLQVRVLVRGDWVRRHSCCGPQTRSVVAVLLLGIAEPAHRHSPHRPVLAMAHPSIQCDGLHHAGEAPGQMSQELLMGHGQRDGSRRRKIQRESR